MHSEMGFGEEHFEAPTPEWWRERWMAKMAGHQGHRGHRGHRGRRNFLYEFGPWGGPGGLPGPFFFGRGPKVGRGDVRAAILVLLAEEPKHGYQVIQELSERSGGRWRPSPGSIYPTLQLLEDEGQVTSEQIEGRRVFRLTDSGRAEVAKRGEDARPPWEVPADAGPHADLRDVGFGVIAAAMQVVRAGSERQVTRAKEILTETRKSLYRLLAEDEPADEGGAET
jgi:DNA-binding PadR family transcriptional regulator